MTYADPDLASSSAKKQKREDGAKSSAQADANLVSLTRRRVWRACESCRRKKIKCDGAEPVCGQCGASGSNCTWIQTRDRAALSRQYVQELENRVIRLESVLGQVAPQVNLANLPTGPIPLPEQARSQPLQTVPGAYPNLPAQGSGSSTPAASRPLTVSLANGTMAGFSDLTKARPKTEQTESEEFVAEQMGTLALDDHGHLRWIGGSSTMSLIDAFRNFSAAEDAAPSPPSTTGTGTTPTPAPPSANLLYFPTSLRFGKVRALPGVDEVEYPPPDLAEKLVAAYFERFHHTLPVLDSISFRAKFRRLMDARAGEGQFGSNKSDAGFVSVVFAVFAVAARFVDDERLTSDDVSVSEDLAASANTIGGEETGGMGTVYYERAMILYYIGATATQLAHVQTFVLLSSFLASLNCLPQAWLLCGQAVRIAQDLGLHRSPKHLVMSPTNKETRRKVWWCVYGLDRMLAVALGRPLGTEDSDCDVEFPLPIDDVDLLTHLSSNDGTATDHNAGVGSLMSGFNALTQLYVIVGKILRTVYAVDAVESCKASQERTQKNVETLDKELTTWCERLPATFKSDPKSPQQVSLGAILCSSYYSALITLHRNFLPTKRKGAPNPNWASVPKAVFASRSCILLSMTTKEAIPRSHHLAFFVQALFSAAVIILLCARFATVESAARTASDEVNTALSCLDALENAWPGAKKCKEMLQELVEATRRDMKVQVPGVGRPGNVNGLVAPTPAGVDKVQTMYNSFKRAANEGARASPGPEPDEKSSRKIKSKPKERTSLGTSRERGMSEGSSPPSSGSANPSITGHGDMDMEYMLQDQSPKLFTSYPLAGSQPVNGMAGLNISSLGEASPTNMQSLANLPSFTHGHNLFGGSSVPHDWLPSPVVDTFPMSSNQFSNEIFTNVPPLPGTQPASPMHMFKMPLGQDFDFGSASAEIPFSGFDFLQDFGSTNSSGASTGFAAGDVAAWTNLVGQGVFNNVPDQPFALVDGSGDGVE